jgi:uncharacterized membrane protein
VLGGVEHPQPIAYAQMEASTDTQVALQFNGYYIQDQDAVSAHWLSTYATYTSFVYSDEISYYNSLVSCAMFPSWRILEITNHTILDRGNFAYLDNLNIERGIVPTSSGLFETSEVISSLGGSDLVYSNGFSEIWSGAG